MLKRSVQILIFGLIGSVLFAWWRWWSIRRNRIPAPQALKLVRNPDTDISIRRNGDTLSIEWSHPTKKAEIYTGSAYSDIDKSQAITVENQQFALLHGISPTRYQVEVVLDDGTVLKQIERVLPLKSVPNFRDIGGYRTKDGQIVQWNRVYRSSALDNLSEGDGQKLQDLEIKLVCDVRTVNEHLADPDQVPDGIEVISFPPSSGDSVWVALARLLFQAGFLENLLLDLYQRVMVEENPQVFASLFQRMADEQFLPMVIHCAAGKDRTGISIALLLAFLGVPDDVIVADYSLSNHYYDFFKQATRKNLAQLRIMGLSESDFDYLLIADADVMQQTLDYVRGKYGSVENYLTSRVGITPETLDAIRHNLLEG